MTNHDHIPLSRLLSFLEWVNNSGDYDATNAAADMHNAIAQGVFEAGDVYAAIFDDGPEADAVEVRGRTVTAQLGRWVISWVQTIRAELPEMLDDYLEDAGSVGGGRPSVECGAEQVRPSCDANVDDPSVSAPRRPVVVLERAAKGSWVAISDLNLGTPGVRVETADRHLVVGSRTSVWLPAICVTCPATVTQELAGPPLRLVVELEHDPADLIEPVRETCARRESWIPQDNRGLRVEHCDEEVGADRLPSGLIEELDELGWAVDGGVWLVVSADLRRKS